VFLLRRERWQGRDPSLWTPSQSEELLCLRMTASQGWLIAKAAGKSARPTQSSVRSTGQPFGFAQGSRGGCRYVSVEQTRRPSPHHRETSSRKHHGTGPVKWLHHKPQRSQRSQRNVPFARLCSPVFPVINKWRSTRAGVFAPHDPRLRVDSRGRPSLRDSTIPD
jgi:hypothetical protein